MRLARLRVSRSEAQRGLDGEHDAGSYIGSQCGLCLSTRGSRADRVRAGCRGHRRSRRRRRRSLDIDVDLQSRTRWYSNLGQPKWEVEAEEEGPGNVVFTLTSTFTLADGDARNAMGRACRRDRRRCSGIHLDVHLDSGLLGGSAVGRRLRRGSGCSVHWSRRPRACRCSRNGVRSNRMVARSSRREQPRRRLRHGL